MAGLFDNIPDDRFDGDTFDKEQDGQRLSSQLQKVKIALANGGWWTLSDLARFTGGSEAGVSARLRDLRKDRFGGHTIERRRRSEGRGTWEYRLAKQETLNAS